MNIIEREEITIMYITNHARDRLKERCGLPKKALERNAKNALYKGISHNECVGSLKKYLDYLYLSHKNGNNIKIYNNHVYIFFVDRLVTVLTLPNIYKGALNKLNKRRGELFS